MVKTQKVMEELRRDVQRWKLELGRLKEEGHDDVVARMEGWITRAEQILERWKDA